MELEEHPKEYVVFTANIWKEERGQDKKRAVREDKTLTVFRSCTELLIVLLDY